MIKNKKRLEITLDENGKMQLGYSIGTVYEKDPDKLNSYKLFNLGYMPTKKKFYYNHNIHLPKYLIEYFENNFITDELTQQLKKRNIYEKKETDYLFKEYNKKTEEEISSKFERTFAKQKLLELDKTMQVRKYTK